MTECVIVGQCRPIKSSFESLTHDYINRRQIIGPKKHLRAGQVTFFFFFSKMSFARKWEHWLSPRKVTLKMSHHLTFALWLAGFAISVCHSFLCRGMLRLCEPMGKQRWGCNCDPGKNSPLFLETLEKCDLPSAGFSLHLSQKEPEELSTHWHVRDSCETEVLAFF